MALTLDGLERPRAGRTGVRYLGHATVLIEMCGLRLLTDPVLRDRVLHLRRRAGLVGWDAWAGANGASPVPPSAPITPAAAIAPVDLVLISHLHHDHLDLPSLHAVGRQVPMLAPVGAGPWLSRRGFHHVEELRPGENFTMGDVRVVATPALHSGRRVPFGPQAGCLGFIVEGPQRIYFAGDTNLFEEMADLRPIDLALLPVWGWGGRPGPGHLDPARAVEALRLIHPAVAVPIHWGTLHPIGLGRWTAASHTRSPHEFAELAHTATPEVDVRVLAPGETLTLPPDDGLPALQPSGPRDTAATGSARAVQGQRADDQTRQEDGS